MAAQTGDDVLVLVGMELTTSDQGHVVVFGRGVEEEWGWRKHDPFPTHIPDHWAAIRAHPFRDRVLRNGREMEVNVPAAPPERIDAVEVWNGGDILKKAPQLRADFHQLSMGLRARARQSGGSQLGRSPANLDSQLFHAL